MTLDYGKYVLLYNWFLVISTLYYRHQTRFPCEKHTAMHIQVIAGRQQCLHNTQMCYVLHELTSELLGTIPKKLGTRGMFDHFSPFMQCYMVACPLIQCPVTQTWVFRHRSPTLNPKPKVQSTKPWERPKLRSRRLRERSRSSPRRTRSWRRPRPAALSYISMNMYTYTYIQTHKDRVSYIYICM